MREKSTHRSTRKLLALLTVFLFSAPLLAQSLAVLRGQVVDETGAVIPGAQITLLAADGKQRNLTSDANGEFTLPNLVPGVYQLTAAFEGFQPYQQKALKVAANNAPLKITLAIAAVAIETTVSVNDQDVSTEPDKNLNATVLDEDFMQTLPDNEDDLRAYLEGLAGPGAGGATGGQGGAQIYIDGFTGGRLPPRDAIMQIRINQNPFTAESSTPGMGRIDIVTKPGRDQWRGAFGLNLRNAALDARNAFAQAKPDLAQTRYQFNLGGPLVAKRLSFFLNAERRTLDGSNTVVARTLDGQFVANVEAPSASTHFSLRADYLLNNQNTLNISYNRSGSSSTNREFAARFGGGFSGGFGGFGGGGFGGGGGAMSGASFLLPERGSNAENTNHTLQFGETWIINPRFMLESRARYQYETSNATAQTAGVAINVLDAFQGGGATCCPNSSTQHSLEWQEYLTWSQKQHTVKSGLQLQHYNIRDYSATNFNGTFTFSSLDQYRAVLNGERVDPNDPNSLLVRPTQFTLNQGEPAVAFNQYQAAWFVQDDWRFRPNLTISLGLRHEFQAQLENKMNFAPRVGLAWSPFKDGKTSVRVGGGVFYSRLNDNLYQNVLRYDGVTQQSFILRNPSWPDPLADAAALEPARTIKRVLDPSLRAPYSLNFTASVERQLPKGFVTSVTYAYTKGLHQFRSRNLNALLPETGARPDPAQGNIYQLESSAKSLYQGLTLSLQRRMGKLFQVFGNYTYSHTNNDSSGALAVPANNYELSSEWGRAATDRRHVLFVGGTVNLPYGLRLNPMVTASSGAPFNITTGTDDNRDTEINDRPAGLNRNGDLLPSMYALLTNRCISGCQPGGTPLFLRDFLQTYYPAGVSASGPGSFNVNLNVSKTFSFGKRETAANAAGQGGNPGGGFGGRRGGLGGPGMMGGGGGDGRFNLQLTAQITNFFNRVNYGQYSGVLGSPFFGQANSAAGARQFEVGLRFGF